MSVQVGMLVEVSLGWIVAVGESVAGNGGDVLVPIGKVIRVGSCPGGKGFTELRGLM
jgi:hypothetical protein